MEKKKEILTTNGVTISVISKYETGASLPSLSRYLHTYHITIVNENPFSVQLLRRHWYIVDAYNKTREVEGPGVIGQQPILQQGEKHSYRSWCPLPTSMGKMYGTYLMKRTDTEEKFEVNIPEFKLIADFTFN